MKVGDTVFRKIGDMVMELKVSAITDRYIICGPWKFDKETGAEIDEDLGWNKTASGSYLVNFKS